MVNDFQGDQLRRKRATKKETSAGGGGKERAGDYFVCVLFFCLLYLVVFWIHTNNEVETGISLVDDLGVTPFQEIAQFLMPRKNHVVNLCNDPALLLLQVRKVPFCEPCFALPAH